MTTRGARPSRTIRRSANGQLFDTIEDATVTLDFVADLVWLGESVHIFDEVTRADRTEAVLAPAIFVRLRGSANLPLSIEGVALARAVVALADVRNEFQNARAEFERLHDRIAGLERLLHAALNPNVGGEAMSGEAFANAIAGT
jgi:PHB/PHA accumulation regulator DNA-binding domain